MAAPCGRRTQLIGCVVGERLAEETRAPSTAETPQDKAATQPGCVRDARSASSSSAERPQILNSSDGCGEPAAWPGRLWAWPRISRVHACRHRVETSPCLTSMIIARSSSFVLPSPLSDMSRALLPDMLAGRRVLGARGGPTTTHHTSSRFGSPRSAAKPAACSENAAWGRPHDVTDHTATENRHRLAERSRIHRGSRVFFFHPVAALVHRDLDHLAPDGRVAQRLPDRVQSGETVPRDGLRTRRTKRAECLRREDRGQHKANGCDREPTHGQPVGARKSENGSLTLSNWKGQALRVLRCARRAVHRLRRWEVGGSGTARTGGEHADDRPAGSVKAQGQGGEQSDERSVRFTRTPRGQGGEQSDDKCSRTRLRGRTAL